MALRKGMWVVDGDGAIGIYVGTKQTIEGEGDDAVVVTSAEFHRVAEDGTTSLITFVDPTTLQQAKHVDIPECRRPSVELAKQLGYEVEEEEA